MASITSPPAAVVSELDSSTVSIGKQDIWFLKTDAVHHMTGNPSLITDLVPVYNRIVHAGYGKGMQVHGTGSVNTPEVVLSDVWYVPGLCMNLVSVNQATTDPDLVINFTGRECIVKDSDGSVIGKTHLRSDYKYEVEFLRIQQN